MEPKQPHPMENLLLFVAKTLREQYRGRPEEEDFDRLIGAAQGDEIKSEALSEEHGQGKIPPVE